MGTEKINLFNHIFTSFGYVCAESNSKMSNGENTIGSSRGLFQGTILAFTWVNWVKMKHCQDSQCPGRVWNRVSPEDKTGALPPDHFS
jgi:hypothetical protein